MRCPPMPIEIDLQDSKLATNIQLNSRVVLGIKSGGV